MNNQLLNKSPNFTVCIYCNSNIKGKHISCNHKQYVCNNHDPLLIRYDYSEINFSGKWAFSGLQISIPQHFSLYYNIKDSVFLLYEWRNHKFGADWYRIYPAQFNYDWVMEQSLDKLFSILNMYKTFL